MKFLIVGLGSIGERHLKNLLLLGEREIIGVEVDKGRRRYMKNTYNIKVFKKIDDALDKRPEACIICTPPAMHIPIALKAAKLKCHLFVEKPISDKIDEKLAELESIVKKNNLICMIGYNHRFNKGILKLMEISKKENFGRIIYLRAEVGQDLPSWRPWQDYKKSYTARKELGGGIILDASHEIDYSLWLVGEEVVNVCSYYNTLSDLEINVEDIAEIIIIFKRSFASIHMNMIEKGYNRYCKIISDKGNWAKYDFGRRELWYSIDGEIFRESYSDYDTNQTYIEEMKHFIKCIAEHRTPITNLYTAKKTLAVSLLSKEGICK